MNSASSPVSPPDPDAIAAAVVACPSVARLSGGIGGEVATYLPGRRVSGVRVGADEIVVHIVARYGPTVATVADEVGTAVRTVAGPWPVSVGVDDVEVSPPPPTQSPS